MSQQEKTERARKTATVSTQLNIEDRELLIQLAHDQDRTLSWIVREAINEYLEKLGWSLSSKA